MLRPDFLLIFLRRLWLAHRYGEVPLHEKAASVSRYACGLRLLKGSHVGQGKREQYSAS